MNKKELREKYLNIRKEICDKENKNSNIFQKVIDMEEYKKSNLVLSYVSLGDEVDTIGLIKYSLKCGKQVAIPKCEGEIINFYYINSLDELNKGSFDILEPQNENKVKSFENGICIVPGVAFDKSNNRIGYGKGYYDRFLQNYNGIKIGLTYKECICEKIDIDKYDVKLDKIIQG